MLSLLSITVTIEKQTDRLVENGREQMEVLKKIQTKLEEKELHIKREDQGCSTRT
ncbi:hypothetical protein QTG56_02545 [Rossellomorea sp. AcN35-11]|nr:hypothetical protein QTG56_02545 [Rossellomorea sp. AcN35-11]